MEISSKDQYQVNSCPVATPTRFQFRAHTISQRAGLLSWAVLFTKSKNKQH